MHRHPHFDLLLHDDRELASYLQSDIVERRTLHQWPLSCVQQLTMADGRKAIYKVQFGPTVESEFYAEARSPLLPWAETIYQSDGYVCMLFEFLEGPLLEKLDLPEEQVVQVGRAVMDQIANIGGELPHYLDVSTESKWEELIIALARDLRALVDQRRFTIVDRPTVRALERWALSEAILSAIRTRPGYVHRDLGGDNLFVLPDGYRVIDWQRPILGPTDLDLASLLESLGCDPLKHVDRGVIRVLCLLHVRWLTECATRWFPQGTKGYDQQIMGLAALIDRG